jgi:mono-ADP-ribosyltransferase sirtuin 6
LLRAAISELHGNTYREVCATCQQEHIRNFSVSDTVENMRCTNLLARLLLTLVCLAHITGRKCDCGGPLKDTIIHFTENMPKQEWG